MTEEVEQQGILLIEKSAVIEQFPGKGGWMYVPVPEVEKDKHAWFGLVKVNGFVDDYELMGVNLMPDSKGIMFLPVNAGIRKAIEKTVGDTVQLKLFLAGLPPVEDDDFLTCLREDRVAFDNFSNLSDNEKKRITDWIYAPKSDNLKVERMALMIEKLITNPTNIKL
ncbi:MAG: DUF1905 domain-containing protein [Paludibacteraceae bacterium]|nr:DUF1905 domain-containing protein [Paludibacteraceae bacterium]